MAIFDYDSTTAYEINKLYAYDGTTTYQIGKVYDNNGTTNSLIYTAEKGLITSGIPDVQFSTVGYYPAQDAGSKSFGKVPTVSQGNGFYNISISGKSSSEYYIGTYKTNDVVDLSQYSLVSITYEVSGSSAEAAAHCDLNVATAMAQNGYSVLTYKRLHNEAIPYSEGTAKTTVTLDVSGFTESAYIGISVRQRNTSITQTVKVYDLHLE